MILFLKEVVHITPEIRIKLKHIIVEQIYSNTPSFEWNKLDVTVRNAKSFLIFKNLLLKIGRPIQNSIFKIHDPLGIKLLTRLRLGLSHLNEHRFRHNFQDYVSHYVPVVWKLNRIFIFSYIANILYNLVKPS